MGIVYLKNKPEADSFSYAYVEAADGNIVRVSIKKMKEALGITTSFETEIELFADNWTVSPDSTYYTQDVIITNATANSRIDLKPTAEQIIQLANEEISLFVANDNGTILVYAMNGSPSDNMTFTVVVSEVL